MTLIEQIRAAIDETERIAKAADGAQWEARGLDGDPWVADAANGSMVAAFTEIYPETAISLIDDDARHIAHNDPAAVLRRCAADRELLDDILADKHRVIEDDCWYTCPAATEERDGGQNCNDDAGEQYDCGRDARVERRLKIMARGLGITNGGEG